MKRPILLLGLALVSMLGLKGCGTQTGNGLVSVNLGAYSGFVWYLPITPAYATVSSVTFCFKRIRFKMANEGTSSDPSQDSDNLDFVVGEVVISPSGTTLGKVAVPPGVYTRIELDLEPDCASGKSVQVSNTTGDGNHSTNDRVTVKFEGSFTMTQAETNVSLGIQSVVSALDTVGADSEIKGTLEAVSGTF